MQKLEKVFVRLKLISESAASSCLIDRSTREIHGLGLGFFFPFFLSLVPGEFVSSALERFAARLG